MEQADDGSLVTAAPLEDAAADGVRPVRAKGRRFRRYFVFWEPNRHPSIAEEVMIRHGTPEEQKVRFRTNIVVSMHLYRLMSVDRAFESEVMAYATAIGLEVVKTVRADPSVPPNTTGSEGVLVEFSYKLEGKRRYETVEGERIPSSVIEVMRTDPDYKQNKEGYQDWYWREATRIRFQVVSAQIKERYGSMYAPTSSASK